MKHPGFANRFKQAVKLSGVHDTQKSLAKLMGVSEVMIWSYKNGEKLPRMSMAVSIAEKLSVSVQWLLEGVGPIDRNTATVYQSQAPYKKTVQAIVDILDELSEAERKDTLTLLQATFPPEPEESEEKKARSEESKNNEGKNDKKKSKDNKSDIADNEKGTAKTVASTPQTNKPPSQRIHSSCSPHPSWECE